MQAGVYELLKAVKECATSMPLKYKFMLSTAHIQYSTVCHRDLQ